jgi:TonB family protein
MRSTGKYLAFCVALQLSPQPRAGDPLTLRTPPRCPDGSIRTPTYVICRTAPSLPKLAPGQVLPIVVALKAVVADTGDVVHATVLEGTGTPFDAEALRCMAQWSFEPARCGSTCITSEVFTRVVFQVAFLQ